MNPAAGLPAVINTYIAMNKPEKALDRVRREMKSSQERPELQAELSRIYVVMGKTPEAVENARQMIRKQPDSAAGYLTLAMVYQSIKEPGKGIDTLKSAAHLRDVNITMMLGNLHAAGKDYRGPSVLPKGGVDQAGTCTGNIPASGSPAHHGEKEGSF